MIVISVKFSLRISFPQYNNTLHRILVTKELKCFGNSFAYRFLVKKRAYYRVRIITIILLKRIVVIGNTLYHAIMEILF